MRWTKGYEFRSINKKINKELNLSKEIHISSLSINNDKSICKDLIISVIDNNKELEYFYFNPRKKNSIKSKYLNKEDKTKLSNYMINNGMKLLDYQLYKINYKELFTM